MTNRVVVADLVERHCLLADEAAVDAACHVPATAMMEDTADVRPGGDDAHNREHDSHQPLEDDRIREERSHDCRCQRSDGTERARSMVHLEQQQATQHRER
jgi:hypothetical protein